MMVMRMMMCQFSETLTQFLSPESDVVMIENPKSDQVLVYCLHLIFLKSVGV